MCHSVRFISLGPGDPDLITIKALRVLQQADIIFYPSTISKSGRAVSRALDILNQLEISAGKLYPFAVPMNKNRSLAIESYNNISANIEEKYKNGQETAVVAEGDAGFYSSIHYIYDYLAERKIPVEHIAGIPAFIACGALAGIHTVKQEEELIVIPGTATGEALSEYLQSGKTIIVMKVSQCQDTIKLIIRQQPRHTYHYFENAGVAGTEYYTSNQNDILNRSIPYFSLMIIKP
ncbi:MAG: precorrin-2 C(20)-methyltransferase [Prevotella sp.]|jgi:precorrin-2/cobalt-factor-2 C20-methyltransferase|nr:precorrin-2 C(20)-methyltransferase [Prevotella sp.]